MSTRSRSGILKGVTGAVTVFGLISLSLGAVDAKPSQEGSGRASEALALANQSRGADLTAIEATLNDYLMGSKEGDVERLRRAFHPTAEIEGMRGDGFTSWTIQDYADGMTPGRVRDFVPRILAVDFTGNAAQAKVEADYGSWKFVDYMQLLKIDGEWKIVNKIYFRAVD